MQVAATRRCSDPPRRPAMTETPERVVYVGSLEKTIKTVASPADVSGRCASWWSALGPVGRIEPARTDCSSCSPRRFWRPPWKEMNEHLGYERRSENGKAVFIWAV